ncbi:glycosyltransferase [Noviherbaspirillum pedocola]|uniref:Glycosyltransferase n=1 Tax=Noviherbaspirillum pedocola TaxID=2801341 RepID=A0A934SMN4_9BURK|nr:glycosyltransferase [Noviherbaspirillum pedocola]MBK4733381.1 glycosyltransferase [Noviherbaspirillum pedocola]
MRIVIDMQGVQASNRQRGIGRYSLSLTKAIVEQRGSHEVILALNGLFTETIEPIRLAFKELLPPENIVIWQCPGPINSLDDANTWRRKSAELLREGFVASLRPDVLLITSLFEGLVDDAALSVHTLSRAIPTVAILYDLIPLIWRDRYLDNPLMERWYERMLGHLRRADLLLAISESSRQEGIQYLGCNADECVNISTAADTQFRPLQLDAAAKRELRNRYGLSNGFLMYTGGIDLRKNIEGLITAYASVPLHIRQQHQLAIVCAVQPNDRAVLEKLASKAGLKKHELVFTGFIPEADLLALYNLCKAFVFPSWHEGFGLPALEAMSCGKAVIASNKSSLPEVIGWSDALFDPFDTRAITDKIVQVLTDENFRKDLERHGIEQAKQFSWHNSARLAIDAIETLIRKKAQNQLSLVTAARRPRLAYVSPLPPQRSGISDYSLELLPELSRYYDIDVIVEQDSVSDPWIRANCGIHTTQWLENHADRYERVIYHFGNSAFHQHMFRLLDRISGIVVLHDFFLSGVVAHMDVTDYAPGFWGRSLYESHGYPAVQHRFTAADSADVVWHYPSNIGVLRAAIGVIVHSEASRTLARKWYGPSSASDWCVIPHLRVPHYGLARSETRHSLGLTDHDFVVCSFGLLGPMKLNKRLVDAWLSSKLAEDPRCILVFVGANQDNDYGNDLVNTIRKSGKGDRIRITGWTDSETFKKYLVAADLAVQLRSLSRGETSGAVLDCMNYALPTIVNANGSMADLSEDGVWKMQDEFENAELITALETLWQNQSFREKLGQQAKDIIINKHNPRRCAAQYVEAIEAAYRYADLTTPGITRAIAEIEPNQVEDNDWIAAARAISLSIPCRVTVPQILVDISELVHRDARSGIQRVVRSILHELLSSEHLDYRIEPVYATTEHGYRYARKFTMQFLGCTDQLLEDDVIEFHKGDIFLGLDLQPPTVISQRDFYRQLRNYGVKTSFVVYDLLPINLPHAFFQGADVQHHQWLSVVTENDSAICISQSVADELKAWYTTHIQPEGRACEITCFHLGADIGASRPSFGLPKEADKVLSELNSRPTFLMVGTIEPRKCHLQVIEGFEQLWNKGIDVNLVIVGKHGWMMEKLVEYLSKHSELGRRLFWLEGISDEYLEKVYAVSTCLIAASENEGFGLPLIEASQHGLSIIARDIPVFQEVAGNHAFYFSGFAPKDIAHAVDDWLRLNAEGKAPHSSRMPWLTWEQSANQLMDALLRKRH